MTPQSELILRQLAAGALSIIQIQRMNQQTSKRNTMLTILQLESDGYMQRLANTVRLTRKGRAAVPVTAETYVNTWRPYVPPKVVRRAGSDQASRLPSLISGKRIPGERRL